MNSKERIVKPLYVTRKKGLLDNCKSYETFADALLLIVIILEMRTI